MMIKMIKKTIQIICSSLFAIVMLSFFVVFYSFSGIHIDNVPFGTDYKWEEHQLKSTMTEGFSFFCVDKNGFNNVISFDDDSNIDILLMGSSQMEAVNVGKHDNTGYLLDKMLPEQRVYNIGISGHQLYNCVNNLSSALSYYRPTEYVVIVTDSVNMDTTLMRQVLDGDYPHIPSYDSGIVYFVQKWIPAVKNLYKNIEDWMAMSPVVWNKGLQTVFNSEDGDDDCYEDNYDTVLISFLEMVSDVSKKNNVKPIIVYQSPVELDEEGMIIKTANPDVQRFEKACRSKDIAFIDMTTAFSELYEKEHRLPHGFANTAVGVGHLNKYGHRMIAGEITKYVAQ